MVVLVQRSRRPRRWAGVAVFAGLLMLLWYWEHRQGLLYEHAPPPSSWPFDEPRLDPPAVLDLSAPPPPALQDPTLTHPPASVVPEGMTAEQWLTLHESLKDHPDREAEIARVSDHMAYRAQLERYRALLAQGPAVEVQTRDVAASLLDALPARVARSEASAVEALALQERLLHTLYPDESARQERREVERGRLQEAQPVPPDLREQAERDARYQREQAALVAAWRALPAEQRDPKQLEASIQALRLSNYANAPTGEQR
ncbi:hypothetical protein [Piscinibacter sp.]|uniref:hypothetical protein n=1 Tax=Piscinibacter sp. TaxID=1903157 RepID=UPI002B810704|nr:hypothetical protein [Albitalea sp.]HUG25085.1 hypothetical protein [Albitalea sp.]